MNLFFFLLAGHVENVNYLEETDILKNIDFPPWNEIR